MRKAFIKIAKIAKETGTTEGFGATDCPSVSNQKEMQGKVQPRRNQMVQSVHRLFRAFLFSYESKPFSHSKNMGIYGEEGESIRKKEDAP